jgi:hypothetical protein
VPALQVDPALLTAARNGVLVGSTELLAQAHRGPGPACTAAAGALAGTRTAEALSALVGPIERAVDEAAGAARTLAGLLAEAAERYRATDGGVAGAMR